METLSRWEKEEIEESIKKGSMEPKIKKAQLIDMLHDKKRDYYQETGSLTKTVFVREEISANNGTAFVFDRYGELSDFYTWLDN